MDGIGGLGPQNIYTDNKGKADSRKDAAGEKSASAAAGKSDTAQVQKFSDWLNTNRVGTIVTAAAWATSVFQRKLKRMMIGARFEGLTEMSLLELFKMVNNAREQLNKKNTRKKSYTITLKKAEEISDELEKEESA